ncbi:hypothetical protein [Teredinibacter haidensis]|uniref:hypothetical protein n=1 Tax=Teredinibacter haidensis TaxID=2731755 RepID=UPI000948FDAB|nr:hypothetical protein [Teredinibacter haidensis]
MGNNSDPVTLHKYLYGGANPVINIDPSGNSFLSMAGGGSVRSILGNLARPNLKTIVGGAAANDAIYAAGATLSSKQIGLFALAAMGASGLALFEMAVETEGEDPEDPEILYHGTSSNIASKIVIHGFRSAPVFFAEDFVSARVFGATRAGLNSSSNVTVIEFTIPQAIADAAITYRGLIGSYWGVPFVDIPGGSGNERVIPTDGQMQIFNGALKAGVISQRRLR